MRQLISEVKRWGGEIRLGAAGLSAVGALVALCLGCPSWAGVAATFALVFITWQYAALSLAHLRLAERPFVVPDPGDILVIPELQENISRSIGRAVMRVFNSGSATALDVCYHSRFLNAPHKRATVLGPHALRPGQSSGRLQLLPITPEPEPEPGEWKLLVLIGFSSPSGHCYAVPCHLGSGDGGWLIDPVQELDKLDDLRTLPARLESLADEIQSGPVRGGRSGAGPQYVRPQAP